MSSYVCARRAVILVVGVSSHKSHKMVARTFGLRSARRTASNSGAQASMQAHRFVFPMVCTVILALSFVIRDPLAAEKEVAI